MDHQLSQGCQHISLLHKYLRCNCSTISPSTLEGIAAGIMRCCQIPSLCALGSCSCLGPGFGTTGWVLASYSGCILGPLNRFWAGFRAPPDRCLLRHSARPAQQTHHCGSLHVMEPRAGLGHPRSVTDRTQTSKYNSTTYVRWVKKHARTYVTTGTQYPARQASQTEAHGAQQSNKEQRSVRRMHSSKPKNRHLSAAVDRRSWVGTQNSALYITC